MKTLFKVISQSEPVSINTQNGQMQKSVIVLQELGGKFEDSYAAALLGDQVKLSPDDYVWASLRFSARNYNGSVYQDVTIQEIVQLLNPSTEDIPSTL